MFNIAMTAPELQSSIAKMLVSPQLHLMDQLRQFLIEYSKEYDLYVILILPIVQMLYLPNISSHTTYLGMHNLAYLCRDILNEGYIELLYELSAFRVNQKCI